MAKAFQLVEAVLSEELLNKINGKLDKSEAVSDFRRKADEITEDDLAPALRLQIQSGGSGGSGPIVDENGNYVAYDDTVLRSRIVALESGKMDKSGMTSYYKKDEIIHEANISPDYKNSVVQQINAVDVKIVDLETEKADKTELVLYRKKADKISEIDLSQTLYDRILAGGGGGTGGVSLETVQTMIGNLDSKKADKTQLDLVRKIADPIKMTDVDAALKDALDKAVIAAAGLTNKADKSELTLYRRKDNPIVLADMDSDLSSQLSIALNAANDIEAFVVEYLSGAKNEIIADITNAYGQQDQLDFPFQWEITMYHYPGNEGHYTVFWALNILYRELKSVIGRAADGGGPAVAGRLPALEGRVTVNETDIADLKSKMSSSESGSLSLKLRVSALESDVEDLQTDLATANGKIADLESRVATLESLISALHPDIAASL